MTKAIKERVMKEFDKRISFWEASDTTHGWSIKVELEDMKEKILGIIKEEFSKPKEEE